MDIADPCDTEPESDLPMLELAQYQKRVLTALADLQLGKKAGWTNTEMEILVCEYDATCGQRGLMRNVYTSIKAHSGRSERSIRRLLSAIRSATGSDAARLVSTFFALAESWTDEQDAILIREYTEKPDSEIDVPGRTENQVEWRIRDLRTRWSPITQETQTRRRCRDHI